MSLAKAACPIPTNARNTTATVTEMSLPAKLELHVHSRVYALLEVRSMSSLIVSELMEYHNANSL